MAKIPALFSHCEVVFALMDGQAEIEPSTNQRIWTGYTTKLIKEDAGYSVPYYSQIMNTLVRMDCVRQLKRGGGGSMSQWLILQRPSEFLFEMTPETNIRLDGKPKPNKFEIMEQRISDLEYRIKVLEENADTR